MLELRRRRNTRPDAQAVSELDRKHVAWQRLTQARSIAHDVRSLLAGITSQAECALRLERPEVAFRALDMILDEARRLDSLLELLAANGEGRGPLLVDLDLSQVVDEEISRLPSRQVERIEMHLAAAPMVADELSIRRMVVNLVWNALVHTDAPITIMVNTGRDVVFTVADRGVGVDADAVPAPGHGQGVGIAESVVALHGGAIDIHPRFGGGTTVTVSLPKRDEGGQRLERAVAQANGRGFN